MTLSSYVSRYVDEIVDDSEPERERLRAQWSRQPRATSLKTTKPQAISTTAVIEISDSESSTSSAGRSPTLEPPPSSEVVPEPSGAKPALNLIRFAFPAATAATRQTNTRTVNPKPTTSDKSKPYQRPPVKKSNPFNLLLADVDKVSQCICCHVSWTRRKTAEQKLNHIQLCAKKHSYDNETVRILVERVAAKTPALNQSGTATAVVSTTYLEDMIQDKPPKRRTKGQVPETLVASADVNRPTILARANDIIASGTPDENLHLHRGAGPITQGFGTGSLGDSKSSKSKQRFYDDAQAPPPTQAFSSSRLGQRPARGLFDQEDDDDNVFSPSSSTSRPSKSSSLSPTLDLARNQSTAASYAQEAVESPPESESDDDQCLVQANVTKARRGRPPKSNSSSDPKVAGHTPQKGQRQTASRKTPTSKRVVFSDDWDSFMKTHIKENDDLHMRILRAEPLDFNLFWEIATQYSPNASTSKLKTELRNFLDNQAILFYEATTWKGKTKSKA